jgi:hypothetical protein
VETWVLDDCDKYSQAFYSQASWGRLEMKPHKPKKKQVQNKSEKGENKGR